MSGSGVSRRDFMQIVGLGGTAIALTGCGNTSIESGVELVESYVQPENFVVPGVGVYYASTCTQCASACGIMGRVREGRVLKLEGNPNSAISGGKICGLGQAAVQQHYSPDRLTTPMIRENGRLKPATWDQAMALLERDARRRSGGQAGVVDGADQRPPSDAAARPRRGRRRHAITSFTMRSRPRSRPRSIARCSASMSPSALIDKAGLVLSFGDDFLGAGDSPVAAARQYARFRRAAPRGMLVQIEPKMTLTGANADRWVVIAPGTEGVFALGLARELLQRKEYSGSLSAALIAAVEPYTQAEVSRITGVRGDLIPRLAGMLWEHAPSLVLAGRYPQGHAHGSRNMAAIALLNVVLQNQGKTLMRAAELPFPQLAPTAGDFKSLAELNQVDGRGAVPLAADTGHEPGVQRPGFSQFAANLQKVAVQGRVRDGIG